MGKQNFYLRFVKQLFIKSLFLDTLLYGHFCKAHILYFIFLFKVTKNIIFYDLNAHQDGHFLLFVICQILEKVSVNKKHFYKIRKGGCPRRVKQL